MEQHNTRSITWQLTGDALPERLERLSQPPRQLFIRAASRQAFDDIMSRPRVAVVGTRAATPYGRQVTIKLVTELACQGVAIISGLAYGIDSIAHRAALEAGGCTMAVLPTSTEDIYPSRHRGLAGEMLAQGGALVSEYAPGTPGYKINFIARNRLVAGLADALLITEASEKSGTMHTATFAMEQGMPVLSVPGNITSPASTGANNLIKQSAIPATSAADILQAIGMSTSNLQTAAKGSSSEEQTVLDLLASGIADGYELLRRSKLAVETFNYTLTMLEITAKIRALGANQWALA